MGARTPREGQLQALWPNMGRGRLAVEHPVWGREEAITAHSTWLMVRGVSPTELVSQAGSANWQLAAGASAKCNVHTCGTTVMPHMSAPSDGTELLNSVLHGRQPVQAFKAQHRTKTHLHMHQTPTTRR